jgi:hypothetical protein
MPNAVSDPESVGCPPSPTSTAGSTAKKLIQAAALAAALVPLGSVAVETATINCVTSAVSGSCTGTGSYSGAFAGEQNNIWKFFADFAQTDLIYTFEITGDPTDTADFELDVNDIVVTQSFLEDVGDLDNFPGFTCIPTFDDTTGECGLFEVVDLFGTSEWEDGYIVQITWFATNAAGQPPDDSFNTILQAMDFPNGDGSTFTNQLANIDYDQSPTPTDPAIGGKGSGFSTFGAFRDEEGAAAAVPEPASLVMLGTGLVGLAYRARRRRRP